MLATALSTSLAGLDAYLIRIEAEAPRGVPGFELVGLAAAAVRESRVRVKSALAGVGVDLSERNIVVNMAPADVPKTQTAFDLALAVAIAASLELVPSESLQSTVFLGELSLAGSVGGVRGALPQLLAARRLGLRRAIVPVANGPEAALVEGLTIGVVRTLAEALALLRGEVAPVRPGRPEPVASVGVDDLSDVRGQLLARRALEIAAAGNHNLLFVGPPGAGKTMLARRMPGILPPLSYDEALEVTAIHSVAGLLAAGPSATTSGLVQSRPFRAPHHTVSDVALVGGGPGARPGEVSLAHGGVLFLDELPEFRRSSLEALRQPMEDGVVHVSRARVKAMFPARPLVVASLNPCPCGHLGDGSGRCACAPERVRAYRARLSGPLLDRFDLHVMLPPVTVAALQAVAPGESSAHVRQRVERARIVQRERHERGGFQGVTNGMLTARELERVARPCPAGARLLAATVDRLGLSARAYGKVLRLARTVADLEGAEELRASHVAEAVGFRLLDRGAAMSSAA